MYELITVTIVIIVLMGLGILWKKASNPPLKIVKEINQETGSVIFRVYYQTILNEWKEDIRYDEDTDTLHVVSFLSKQDAKNYIADKVMKPMEIKYL